LERSNAANGLNVSMYGVDQRGLAYDIYCFLFASGRHMAWKCLSGRAGNDEVGNSSVEGRNLQTEWMDQ